MTVPCQQPRDPNEEKHKIASFSVVNKDNNKEATPCGSYPFSLLCLALLPFTTRTTTTMSTPVVVQGTPVSMPQQATPAGAPSNPEVRGEKQETRCNDIPFAILFYANLVAIIAVAFTYGPDALSVDDDEKDENGNPDRGTREYDGYAYAAVICVFLSILGSIGGLMVMMCIPETLIKAALIFVVIMAGVWMVLLFLSGAMFAGVFGLIFFAISICYARAVW